MINRNTQHTRTHIRARTQRAQYPIKRIICKLAKNQSFMWFDLRLLFCTHDWVAFSIVDGIVVVAAALSIFIPPFFHGLLLHIYYISRVPVRDLHSTASAFSLQINDRVVQIQAKDKQTNIIIIIRLRKYTLQCCTEIRLIANGLFCGSCDTRCWFYHWLLCVEAKKTAEWTMGL